MRIPRRLRAALGSREGVAVSGPRGVQDRADPGDRTARPPVQLLRGLRPLEPPGWQWRRQGRCPLTAQLPVGHHALPMLCPEVRRGEPARRDALLELRGFAVRGRPRGDPRRAAGEDPLPEARGPTPWGARATTTSRINEPSISKLHARFDYQDGRFFVEDAGSLHGVYVNAAKVRRAELAPGAQIQLGNVTLKFSLLGSESATGAMAKLPWVEQQQLLLSLVQTLNSTLVLSQVLEQVLDAIMHITGAERGFLLLADGSSPAARYPAVAGLRLRVVRGRTDGGAVSGHGISGGDRAAGARDGRGGLDRPLAGGGGRGRGAGRPRRRGHAAPSRPSCACPCAPPAPGPTGPGHLPPRPGGPLRGQRRLRGAVQRRRPARGRGAGPPRRARHRERPALRAGAAHDRGAAEGPEAAAAVGEAGDHRPDGGGHRPRAQHPAHLHHGQPGAARAAGALPLPAGHALLDRPRGPSASGRWPSACSPSAARAARRWRPSRSTTWSSGASSCASTRSRAAA